MGKRYGIILTVIGLISFCYVEGWGANWTFFASSFDYGNFYYDAESITHPSKGVVRVSKKTVFNGKAVMDIVRQLGQKYKTLGYSIDLAEVHCAEKEKSLLSLVWYSTDGGILQAPERAFKWGFTVPESVDDILYKIVCK